MTANSGTFTPRSSTFNGAWYQRSSRSTSTSPGILRMRLRASRQRSPISAQWAIVNESIAPNAYSVPRNSSWPGNHHEAGDQAEHDDPDRRACGSAG